MSSIKFLGGAGTVTGSKFLYQTASFNILIECGLFQGLKELRLQNREPLPLDPKNIDAVLITHAHLDHTGYLPLLVRNGFRGKIYCTPPTRDLMRVILYDSARIQEEDADLANRMGYSKHVPAKPLYTLKDAEQVFRYVEVVPHSHWNQIKDGAKFRFSSSGHILGSAFIELDYRGKRIVFSGDLGRQKPLTLHPPTALTRADYLLIESTYGDREHEYEPVLRKLARIVNETVARKGHLIIPSFAVGRSQDLLYLFSILRRQKQIPNTPIFLDSPMGIHATEILNNYPEWHKLSQDEMRQLCSVGTMVRSQQQSQEIIARRHSSIVIAGSGMAAGGRILHHLYKRLPQEKNTVLLVGFQAAGSRGKTLQERAPAVKIHGEYVPIQAHIEEISSLSAHADQSEILTWLKNFKKEPRQTFIIHGEPQAADCLRLKLKDTLGWDTVIPQAHEEIALI